MWVSYFTLWETKPLNLHNSETIQICEMKWNLDCFTVETKQRSLKARLVKLFLDRKCWLFMASLTWQTQTSLTQKLQWHYPWRVLSSVEMETSFLQVPWKPIQDHSSPPSATYFLGTFFLQKTFLTSKLVHQKSKLHHPHSTITPHPATTNHHHHTSGWLVRTSELTRHGRSPYEIQCPPEDFGTFQYFLLAFCWEEFMTVMLFSLRDRASLILRYVYIHLYV